MFRRAYTTPVAVWGFFRRGRQLRPAGGPVCAYSSEIARAYSLRGMIYRVFKPFQCVRLYGRKQRKIRIRAGKRKRMQVRDASTQIAPHRRGERLRPAMWRGLSPCGPHVRRRGTSSGAGGGRCATVYSSAGTRHPAAKRTRLRRWPDMGRACRLAGHPVPAVCRCRVTTRGGRR